MAERRRCAQICWSSLEGDEPGPISVWPHDRDMSRSKRDVVPMVEYHPEVGERVLTAEEFRAVVRLICSLLVPESAGPGSITRGKDDN